jgi:hypothetical protein
VAHRHPGSPPGRLPVKGGKSVELVAARKIEWDLKIEEFRDDSFYRPEDLHKQLQKLATKEVPGSGKSDAGRVGPGKGSPKKGGQEDKSAEKR